ncbi:MAG: hypothetical protein KAI53_00260 [Candidatus Aenigmarchaeota archaeon]|nr:hypothetical protein [Candidatus Aenigmarchaeota archaeon]
MKKHFLLLVAVVGFFLSFACSALAIGVSPARFDAGLLEMNKIYEYSVYLSNDENNAYNITLLTTPRAEYLTSCVTFSQKQFEIKPGEIKNIKIMLNTGSCELTPGNHQIIILPEVTAETNAGVKTVSLSSISVQFSIEGVVHPVLLLEDFEMPTKLEAGEEFQFSLTAKNTGNVRVCAIPFVDIKKYGVIIHTARGTTEALIEPGATREFEFSHNYPIAAGDYIASAYIIYFDGRDTDIKDVSFTAVQGNILEDAKNEDVWDSTSFAPEFFETINIGDESDIFTGEQDAPPENYPGAGAGIAIVDLEAYIVAQSVSMSLSFKNRDYSDIDYSFSVAIFDSEDFMVADAKEDSTVRAHELKNITKVLFVGSDKTYVVKVNITYSADGIEKTVQRRVVAEVYSSPTGMFAYGSSTGLFAVVLIFTLLYLFNNRKSLTGGGKKPLDAVLNKYSNIERNISAVEERIHRLKKKIRR